MGKTRSEVMDESKGKGLVAGVAAAATVAAGVLIGPIAAGVAAVPAAYFGYKWWRHRAQNGIRF